MFYDYNRQKKTDDEEQKKAMVNKNTMDACEVLPLGPQ